MVTLDIIRINLIEAIKLSKHSQREIAKAIGVSEQTISEYVHGKSMPALDSFANLCKFIDEDPAEILGIK